MKIHELIQHFRIVRQDGPDDYFAYCPAHDDTNASLHIVEKDGKILLNCFGGCQPDAIVEAVGLRMNDLFTGGEPQSRRGARQKYGLTLLEYANAKKLNPEWLKLWHVSDGRRKSRNGREHQGVRMEYVGADGKVKAVRWRMMMQKGQGANGQDWRFAWDKGNKTCLYGLWRLGEWSDKSSVIAVEGESDCHSLWTAGFPALGFPGAANYNPQRDDQWLGAFKKIVVLTELDSGGKNLYKRLYYSPLADRIYFAMLDGAYKDASSLWMGCNGQAGDFVPKIKEAVSRSVLIRDFQKPDKWNWSEKDDKEMEKRASMPDFNPKEDDGRAKTSAENGKAGGRPKADILAAVADYADTLRDNDGNLMLRYWRGSWWRFDGKCYRHTLDTDVENEVMAFLQRPEVVELYNIQPSRSAMGNMVYGLRSTAFCGIVNRRDAPFFISSGDDASAWSAFGNALVNLEVAARRQIGDQSSDLSGVTRDLTADWFGLTAHDYDYSPMAKCPRWLAWLEEFVPNQDERRAIQQMMGLMLVPDTGYGKFFCLVGLPGSGKSTLQKTLTMLIGLHNCCSIDLIDMDYRFTLWQLTERLANIVEDIQIDDPQGKLRYIEDKFKGYVTGGIIDATRKMKDPVPARAIARHIFSSNFLPRWMDKSSGIWDRMVVLPFSHQIRGTGREVPDYHEYFRAELPGILNWSLAGLASLRQEGHFVHPEIGEDLKVEHRDFCDPDGAWIRDNMVWRDNATPGDSMPVSEAYKRYRDWLQASGLSIRSALTFQSLVCRFFGCKVAPRSQVDRVRVFVGVKWKMTVSEVVPPF
jgi:P4 family phage/plasmid primase-like protien